MMLSTEILNELKDKKNLLAFSAGVDSTALFFILIECQINFDIAIVDYGLREQSKEEVLYAKELASSHDIVCHLFNASQISTNFEATARAIRYDFFHSLITEFHYDNLLTAHHLGDRFEWMLMQFCKGAGCPELSSMKSIDKNENYSLLRPLLNVDKQDLQTFLDNKHIKYFIDESNSNQEIKRNYFRHAHSDILLKKYKEGIKKSFSYIDNDAKELIKDTKIIKIKDFAYFNSHNKRSDIYLIDKYLKSCNLMITASERELLKIQDTLIVGRKYVVNWHLDFVFIAPYDAKSQSMSHEFKEKMRVFRIEPKLRSYFFANEEVFESLASSEPLQ